MINKVEDISTNLSKKSAKRFVTLSKSFLIIKQSHNRY